MLVPALGTSLLLPRLVPALPLAGLIFLGHDDRSGGLAFFIDAFLMCI